MIKIFNLAILFLTLSLAGCGEDENVKLLNKTDDPFSMDLVVEIQTMDQAISQGHVLRRATPQEKAQIRSVLYRFKAYAMKLARDSYDSKTTESFFLLLKNFEAFDFVERDSDVFNKLYRNIQVVIDHYATIQNVNLDGLEWKLYGHAFVQGIAPYQQVPVVKGGAVWEMALGKFAKIGGRGEPTDNWLVSPYFDLETIKKAQLSFKHTVRNPIWEKFQLYVSDNYDGANPLDATWEEIEIRPSQDVQKDKWTDLEVENLSLDKYIGRKIVIAFRYRSESENNTVWEILSLEINGSGQNLKVENYPITYEVGDE